jgi:hypothetical protein
VVSAVRERGYGHEARPLLGSIRSQRTGRPCSLMNHHAYPVAARCAECGDPITAASFYAAFYHETEGDDH